MTSVTATPTALEHRLPKSAVQRRYPWVLAGCVLVLIPVFLISVGLGSTWISPGRVIAAILQPTEHAADHLIVWDFRLPRILIAMVAGMMLAAAGCLLQVVTRNSLAEPSLTGVTAGSVSVIAFWVSYVPLSVAVSVPLPFVGLVGGLCTVGLMYLLSYRRGKGADPMRLILTGLVLDAMFGAFTSFALILNGESLSTILFYLIGSLEGRGWADWMRLWPWGVGAGIAALLMMAVANALNLGDAVATGLGQRVSRARGALLVVAAMLTAGAVSVVGGIAFIGLIAPHVARRLVGSDVRRLLPTTMLIGAVILSLASFVSQLLNLYFVLQASQRTAGLPVGAVTAVVGAVFFFYMLWRRVS
jgi:iron complex transport system permease protein